MKQEWYSGFRAQIIAYTLAKFSYEIKKMGKFIDLNKIWMKQSISENMENELMELAESVSYLITETDENPTQFHKKEVCWEIVKKDEYFLEYDLSKDLIDGGSTFERKTDAKKKQKVLSGINLQIEVVERGQEYWTSLYKWACESRYFFEKELSILGTTMRMGSNPPSEKQCKVILEIEKVAIEEGFHFKG